ncbi:pyridine nucleotide-disulfide oxidoreductase/dicluster-binding protein [Desulfotomaculum copahuensis]|uniref:Amine oxidase n=1 Tax=Desulfotomaculum copahuensis TaxID=1838280 RepID=A0A1B7LHK2_9FIRM|nr:pyridine nucleotide-disulfide oxidoreductase/dicluster-binding protein [Desulfotomaculum copahuensis]OAT85771.1 amine oxidase [Desulfotomaculum copahuensis]
MDHKQWREYEERCTQERPPACTAACPVHVDVRSFTAEMKAGNFNRALDIFRKTVPFAGIIGRICDHPCQAACRRGEAGDPVSIAALEKACVEMTSAPPAKITLPPKKDRRVAVAGGGLSGLAAAFDLAGKGYPVVLFEATDRLGGGLWEMPAEVLPRQIILTETAVLEQMGVEIRYQATVGQVISLPELCSEYDAVYLGTGENFKPVPGPEIDQAGRCRLDPVTLATGLNGVFAGGGLRTGPDYSPINSLSDGRRAAISIDRFLQKVSLTAVRENEGPYQTRLFTSTKGVEPLPAVAPGNPAQGYTREEAVLEAGRCLACQCLECVKVCEYLAHFKSYPKKYARDINQNLKIVMGVHGANNLINSCSLCGLCREVCPENFDMAELCRVARAEMFKKGKMPPSAHDFPLRDMAFSNGEQCALTRHQSGHASSSHLFFPGCQLSASAPGHVERAYAYLTGRFAGGVGLMLRCCGAPAEWSGRTGLFAAELQEIRKQWREMGGPRLILACSTCYRMFKSHLPEIEIVSLWEIYDQLGLPEAAGTQKPGLVAIQDACTTRHEKQIHQSVRSILQKLGFKIEELPASRETTECCGYGGLMLFANRKLADDVINRRIRESAAGYVAYCAMCRDNFSARGKKTYHLLDLIYGLADFALPPQKGPGYSQRRENRARLKNKLLKEIWRDQVVQHESAFENIKLIMPAAVSGVMEERLILKEDVQKVIEYAERTGNKIINRNNGHIMACHRPVSVTYWVEYTPQADGFVVHNAYSHRMEVEGNN